MNTNMLDIRIFNTVIPTTIMTFHATGRITKISRFTKTSWLLRGSRPFILFDVLELNRGHFRSLLALVLPALFFAGLDKREIGLTTNISTRDQLVSISQGLAVVLLSTYICAILFFHPTLEDRSAPSLPPAPSSPPISMPLASTSHAQHNLLSQSPQPVTKEHEQNQNQPIVSSQSHTQQGPQINIAACILLIFVALSSMCITTYFVRHVPALVSAVHAMHASTSSPLSGVQIRAEYVARPHHPPGHEHRRRPTIVFMLLPSMYR
ncbi:hypothetical protein EYR38_005373 [Pleurotus pulmonarius]|nr:hypothetical protein EYR38_005373 [Pleurotus pulmonarius]